ncbi:MAG: hypothetical protein H7A41_07095 [Chlamydiales bacterium]|nr:hypothetical protein [Chlamydiales bacterium]
MAQVLFSQALEAYSKFQTLTDTDAAKQKIIQTVALLVVANAAYNASRTRLTQATISMSAATVLWMNQEAFLHKALSENVASFSVENERLGGLIGQFEQIGMDLKSLSASEREQLQKQMSQFHSLFEALTATVREQSESARASHTRLRESVDLSTSKLAESQKLLAHVFQQVIRTFESVESARTDIPALTRQVEVLNEFARSVLQQDRL